MKINIYESEYIILRFLIQPILVLRLNAMSLEVLAGLSGSSKMTLKFIWNWKKPRIMKKKSWEEGEKDSLGPYF